jgi:hypothetical protein
VTCFSFLFEILIRLWLFPIEIQWRKVCTVCTKNRAQNPRFVVLVFLWVMKYDFFFVEKFVILIQNYSPASNGEWTFTFLSPHSLFLIISLLCRFRSSSGLTPRFTNRFLKILAFVAVPVKCSDEGPHFMGTGEVIGN